MVNFTQSLKKSILSLAVVALVLLATNVNAQVSCYTFAQATGATYTVIPSPTTVHAATWDDNVAAVTIPFTFTFNGIGYTSCSVNSNGYVTFGATTSTTTGYTPISSATGYAGAISAFGRDLVNNATTITYGTNGGTTPNRVFIIQWNGARRYSSVAIAGDVLNYQIRLYETSNKAEIMYGTCTATSATALTCQVGLRGAANTDYNNRTATTTWSGTTAGGANSATVTSSNTIMPASGLTFTWTPPATTAPNCATQVLLANAAINKCDNNTFTWTAPASACGNAPTGYKFYLGTDGGGTVTPTTVINGTNLGNVLTTTVTGLSYGTTYYWQVKATNSAGDAAGCTIRSFTTAAVAPSATITPANTNYCGTGSATTLSCSAATSYLWSTGATTQTLALGTPAANSSNFYRVTATDANGCTASATKAVNVYPNPALSASASPTTVCPSNNSTLTASGSVATPFYTLGAGPAAVSTSGLTAGTYTTAPSGDDVVSNAVNIGFSFTFFGNTYTTFQISTNGNIQFGTPPVSNAWTPATIPSATVPTAVGNTGINNYIALAWRDWTTVGAGEINYYTTGSAPNRICLIDFNDAGNYVGQIVLRETSNTIDIITTNIATNTSVQGIENSGGTAGFAVTGRNNASWASTTISSFTFTPMTPSFTYAWSNVGSYLNNAAIQSPTFTAPGTTGPYAYTVTATEAGSGCTATATTTVTVASTTLGVTASASPNPVCSGKPTTLTAVPSGGCAPYTYAWSSGGTGITTSISPVIAGTYNVTVTDNTGATASSAVNVNVNPNPSVNITSNPANATICGAGNVVLTGNGSGGTGALTYAWSPTTGLAPVAGNVAVETATPSTNTTYVVTVTDINLCSATANQLVTVNPFGVTLNINPATVTTCAGTDVPIAATATTFTTTVVNNATGITIPALGSATPFPSAIAVSGLPTSGVSVSSITINGFTHTFTSDVDALLVSPTSQTLSPISDVGSTAASNVNLTFKDGSPALAPTVTGTYAPTNTGATDDWSSIGVSGTGYAPTTTTLAGFTGNMNGTWNLYVKDDASSDAGSITSWSITFKVTQTTGFTYAWSPAGGLTPGSADQANETANVAVNTTYTVTATYTNGCSATGTSAITISSAALTGTPVATPSAVCAGSTSTLNPQATGGCPPYTYAWSDGLGSAATAVATVSVATTYHVTVSDAGAVNTSVFDFPVTVLASPSVSISTNPAGSAICASGNVVMTANGSGGTGALTYTWSPTTALLPVAGTAAIETATPTTTTVYTVTVKDVNLCSVTAAQTVNVVGALTIPTISATPASICSGDNSQLLVAAVQVPATVTANAYTFSTNASGGTLASMGGSTNLLSNSADDTPSSVQTFPSSFAFVFEGVSYTQYSVSPDGWLKLGGGAATSQFTNAVTSATNVPKLYPFWDDLATGSDGHVSYKMFGSAPNRHFVIEWQVTVPRSTGGTSNSTFQLWLFETTNVVEFHYGTMGTPSLGTISSGITGLTSTRYNSVTFTGNSASSATPNNANTNTPASARRYRFTPPTAAATYSYVWSNPGGFLSATNIDNPVATAVTSSQTYSVTATSSLGCTATATTSVTVAPLSVSAITATPSTVCSAAATTISATATGGGTPYTYAWSTGQTAASFTANPTVNPTVYTVTVSDACSGTATATVSVTVNPLPAPTITPTGTGIICGGNGTKVLTAGGGGTYLWSTTATTAAITTPTITSNTSFTVTVTGANTCTASASYTVTVSPAISVATPTANPNPVCTGDDAQLNVGATQVNAAYTQAVIAHNPIAVPGGATVLVDDVTTALLASGDLDDGYWTVALPFTFTFNGTAYSSASVGTNGNLMFGSTLATVGYGNTLPSATDPDDFIAGLFGDLDMSVIGSGDITYFTTGVSPNQKFIVDFSNCYFFTFGTAGSVGLASFQMVLYETSNQIDVFTTNVTNTTLNKSQGVELAGSIATTVSGRNNSSSWTGFPNGVRFTPPATPVFTYAWTNTGGYLTSTTIQNPIAQAVLASTVYNVTATDVNGCTATSPNFPLNTKSLPTPMSATNDGPYCIGTTINLNSGPNSATSYAWSGPGVFTAATQAADNGAATLAKAGTYTVTVTGTNSCTATASTVVSVTTPPTANAGAATASVCTNVAFTVSGASASNNSGVVWTHDGLGVLTDDLTLTPTYTPASGETGLVTLVLHAVGNGPCAEATSSKGLTINPRPTFTTTQTNVSCFGGNDGTITVTTTLGTTPFDFSKNGGTNYASNQTSPYTFSTLAATAYSIVVRDNNGCVSLPQAVTITQPVSGLSVLVTNNGPYSAGQTITLTSSPSGGTLAYTYSWSGPTAFTSLVGPVTTRINALANMSGIYKVTVTDANGCTATAQTTVNVYAGTVWTGTVNTDWHNPLNWSPANVPDLCIENVVITNVTNKPVVSTTVNVGNVTMNAGGQITLNADLGVCGKWTGNTGALVLGNNSVVFNGSLAQSITGITKFANVRLDNAAGATVIGGASQITNALELKTGTFTVNAASYLTFTSTSASQCAVIDNFSVGMNGTLAGSVKMQRYYNAPTSPSFKTQHYMGSPANAVALTQFGANGTEGYVINPTCDELKSGAGSPTGNMAQYDEDAPGAAICDLQGWKIIKTGNTENARGYSVSRAGAGSLTISGTPNLASSYTRTGLTNSNWTNTTLQGHVDTSGWHILSNPWLANLELSPASGGAGMDNQVAVWQTTGPFAGGYKYYQKGFDVIDIAPFQAFLVHKTAIGGTALYTINGSDRKRTPSNVLFQSMNNDQELAINVDNATGLTDRTIVAFNSDATNSFDPIYDGNKLWGDPARQSLYTENNGMPMARNTLTSINNTSTVAMGFDCGTNGTFTMNFEGLNTFDATSYITVEDRKTNVFHDVRNGNYTFTSDTLDNLNRFVIHFTPAAVITKTDATCNTTGTINVVQPGTANWNYTVANSNSVAVSNGSLNTNSPITLHVPTGVYSITLVDNNNYTVVKQVQVNGVQQVTASFTASATTVEQDDNIQFVSTATNALNNTWNFGDNTTATGLTVTHSYAAPGNYTAILASDNSDCNAISTQQITVTAKTATGINTITDNKGIAIWSSENTVYVDMSKQPKVDAQIEIYNVLGQQLSNEKFGNSTVYKKAFTNLEAAYVIVRVKNNEEIITKKVFIANSK